ncbi:MULTISPECIES: ParB/RepB/Spo0J family partition protein [Mameliella]|uniref:ParB/RepB/Spo0J family partition protein n=1 Tax=Mameliella TaxID=1434019 RepID=UPI000B530416|nr:MULTISPECIES: ParB/RepB/Spo0J family partition protein [Mameliella]MCR9273244.1 ParB/RepB/Spo0J family partition protein [Paracoccaceae bacterium]OWV58301.1 chromosome partitioning protein ParB [Mameliella alba]
MGKIITTITELPVDEIDMGNRLRPVSVAGVEALKTSIRELGVIKDPIHVRKLKKGGKIVLLAGGHRLTAARELRDEGVDGYETIKVTCWNCTDDFAQLMEIDDNLAGAELSALDTAVFLARRKEVYEKMHPEAKAQIGAGLVAKRWDTADTMSVVSFAEAVAQTMGVSDRHVRRLVRAGTVLDPRDIQLLRSAPKPVALADLMELSKISEVTDRYDVVDLMSKGEAKSAADAVRQVKAARGEGPAPKDATDASYARIVDAWKRANKAARRRFLEEHGTEVWSLLDEMDKGLSE